MPQPSSFRTTPDNDTATSSPASEESPRRERRKLDLSLTGLIAGSLAAITAAALGAQLGVAGTIIGAGVGSIISAVSAAIFNTSLQEGSSNLRVAVDRAAQRRTKTFKAPHAETTPGQAGWGRFRTWLRAPRSKWRVALVGALVTFLIAFGVITAYEAITGQSLSGDRGSTTIGRVVDNKPGDATPTETPQNPSAPAPTSTDPSLGSTESGDVSPSPHTQAPSTTRAPAPEPSSAPTEAPAPNTAGPAPTPAPDAQDGPAAAPGEPAGAGSGDHAVDNGASGNAEAPTTAVF